MYKSLSLIGALLTLLSAFAYAIVGLVVKTKVHDVNSIFIIAIQSIITLILIIPIIAAEYAWPTIKSSPFKKLHLVRAVCSMGISLFLFLALKNVPLVNALTLLNTAPLLVPFIAFFIMRQPFNHILWLPMAVGLVGVIIILHPHFDHFNWHNLFALAGALCMACSTTLAKKSSSHDNALVICAYYFFFSTIISLLLLFFFWQPITLATLGWLILVGVAFFITQYALSMAIRFIAPESVLTLYYSNIIFAALLEVIFMQDHLEFHTIIGILLASLAGIACILLQSKKART